MGREDAADSAIGHASEKTQTGTVVVPGIGVLDGLCACDDSQDQNGLPNHPDDELLSTK